MLKHRIITATILVTLTLAALFFSTPLIFLILTGLMILAATAEWANLMELKSIPSRLTYLFLMLFMMYGALNVPTPLIFCLACIWWLIAAVLVFLYPNLRRLWSHRFIKGLMGIITLLPCWAALNVIRYEQKGIALLLFLFIIIWSADTAAYFVGRQWGKHKLAPKVSPGKTVEGFLGAVLLSLIVASICFYFARMPGYLWLWGILLVFCVVLFSVIGDLFESMLKREANLKDSGKLLPGHGGILDRIDSLTAAAPIFISGLFLIKYFFH